uniref:B30.2/SPRY domain-containing protein n=1 Tax=Salmo trutta TaxID=8032 RepID=A0A673ZVY0_SALTR
MCLCVCSEYSGGCSASRAQDQRTLTLDPNTAGTHLSLSKGNRKVTCTRQVQPYPGHPDRFTNTLQVLCREGLSGRCYWEVEWTGYVYTAVSYKDISRTETDNRFGFNNKSWSLQCYRGDYLTYKGISRRGWGDDCCLGYSDKSWCLFCSDNSYSACHNNNSTTIDVPSSRPHRVGVYLDWPAGTLSFYRASSDTLTHLITFTSTFTEPLYPGFGVYDVGDSVSLK